MNKSAPCGFCNTPIVNEMPQSINAAVSYTKMAEAPRNITFLGCNHFFHSRCIPEVANLVDSLPPHNRGNAEQFSLAKRSICQLCSSQMTRPPLPARDTHSSLPSVNGEQNEQLPLSTLTGRPVPPPGYQDKIPQRRSAPVAPPQIQPSRGFSSSQPPVVRTSSNATILLPRTATVPPRQQSALTNNPPPARRQQPIPTSTSSFPQSRVPFSYMAPGGTPPQFRKGVQTPVQEQPIVSEAPIASGVPTAPLPPPPATSAPRNVPRVRTQEHSFEHATPHQIASDSASIGSTIGKAMLGMGLGTAVAGAVEMVTENAISYLPRVALRGICIPVAYEIATFAYRNIFHPPVTTEEFVLREQGTALRVATYALGAAALAFL